MPSEQDVQWYLARMLMRKQHGFAVPNIKVHGSEYDLLSITNSGYLIDHEIKVSRSDFRAEMRAHESDGMTVSYSSDIFFRR
jgi:hypothetical protein